MEKHGRGVIDRDHDHATNRQKGEKETQIHIIKCKTRAWTFSTSNFTFYILWTLTFHKVSQSEIKFGYIYEFYKNSDKLILQPQTEKRINKTTMLIQRHYSFIRDSRELNTDISVEKREEKKLFWPCQQRWQNKKIALDTKRMILPLLLYSLNKCTPENRKEFHLYSLIPMTSWVLINCIIWHVLARNCKVFWTLTMLKLYKY